MKFYLINIIQLAALTVVAWRLTHLVMKVCYFLYPIGLKWGGSKPEEIYNFGVSDGIFWMLACSIAFFGITLLERRYSFQRVLSNAYALILVLLITYHIAQHIKEMVALSFES